MERIENPESRPATNPTIVIARDRGGWFARLVGPLLLLFVILFLFQGFFASEAGLPVQLREQYVAGSTTGAKVALVEVTGVILGDEIEHAIKQVRQARDDVDVRAVVLRIDSPGGTVSGADRIWREVELLKARGKPVVASMGGLAASGGYYIAASADRVFAEPTTLTGSIGVILEIPNIATLLDKVGVEFQTLTTGEWKDSPSLFRPLTEKERTRWNELIGDAYDRFVRIVAQGRRLSLEAVRPLADGRVFTADEARDARLIDEIGYQDDAILYVQRLAKVEAVHVVRYARPKALAEALLGIRNPEPGIRIDPDLLLKLQTPRLLYLAR